MSACVIKINGEPHILSSTKDVSEIRRSEWEAIRASQAKTDFLANMSHELRTPLNAIIGFSDALNQGIFGKIENEKHSEYLTLIEQSGTHLLEIVNDVLDMSKIEAGEFELKEERLDLADIIQDCIRIVAFEAKKGNINIVNK